MPEASLPQSDVFATVEANSDYLATGAHYLALANRIVAALQGGSSFVLLTGDPPASLQLLSQALKATESRHPVIGIPCGPELTYGEVMSAASLVRAVSAAGNTTAVAEFSELTSPLVIFDDVDRLSRALSEPIAVPRPRLGNAGEPSVVVALPTSSRAMIIPEPSEVASPLFVFGDVDDISQEQLRLIYEATIHPDWLGAAGVLLARPGFLTRLEEPGLNFLKEHLVAKLDFHEIGQGECIEFRCHQLENRPGRRETRAGRRRLVRGLTGYGVLLTAGIGAFFLAHHMKMVGEPIERFATGTSLTREISASVPKPSTTTSPAPTTTVPAAERPSIFPSVLPQARRYATTPAQLQPEGLTQEPSPATTPAFAGALETLQEAPLAASSTPTASLTKGRLSQTNIAALVARGDEFLGAGDITSARLFYERAANGGDGPSALRLGATFDPAFLGRAGIRGMGDLNQASSWYRRARELDAAALQQ